MHVFFNTHIPRKVQICRTAELEFLFCLTRQSNVIPEPGSRDGLVPALEELVKQDVDLIFSVSTQATLSAHKVVGGTDIPVVFSPMYAPVESGVVESIRKPGGNLTGVRVGGPGNVPVRRRQPNSA